MKRAIILIDWIECPKNVLFKLRIEDYLKANGYEIVSPSKLKTSDLVLYCGCGFIIPHQRRGFQIIKAVNERIRKLNSPPMFIVVGCIAVINKKELGEIHHGITLGAKEIDKLDEIINATTKIADIPNRNEVKSSERKKIVIEIKRRVIQLYFMQFLIQLNSWFKRTFITIFKKFLPFESEDEYPYSYYQMGDKVWSIITSTGCLSNCSYCSIRFAKGRLKSRSVEEIVEEAKKGISLGYKWISLIADDNSVYGQDINTNIAVLLNQISKIEGDFNILIDDLGPKQFVELYDKLIEVFKMGKIKRIQLAVQHVNPRILNSMNRNYDVNMLKKSLIDISETLPSFLIDTHLIYGYPGETEQEFQELEDFAKWLIALNPLNEFKLFLFSPNRGTPAAELPDQIPLRVSAKRRAKLNKIYPIYASLQHNTKQLRKPVKNLKYPRLAKILNNVLNFIGRVETKLMMTEWIIKRH